MSCLPCHEDPGGELGALHLPSDLRNRARSTAIATAIYARISRDTEGGLGVKRQRGDCEALAKKLGWTVVKAYEDNDVSATRSKPRLAYQRMMADVEREPVQAVVVWGVDRLARTPHALENVIDHTGRIGLRLASVGDDIDLATEQGRMMARMKGTAPGTRSSVRGVGSRPSTRSWRPVGLISDLARPDATSMPTARQSSTRLGLGSSRRENGSRRWRRSWP